MNLFSFYLHLVAVYAQRLSTGPPLNECEFCLYEQLCKTVEHAVRSGNEEWERTHDSDGGQP